MSGERQHEGEVQTIIGQLYVVHPEIRTIVHFYTQRARRNICSRAVNVVTGYAVSDQPYRTHFGKNP